MPTTSSRSTLLTELREDNVTVIGRLREIYEVVYEHRDMATASLIENWITEAERHAWFLLEASGRETV